MTWNILKGLHRRTLGIGYYGHIMGRRGFASGGDDKPIIIHPSPDNVAIFEDFIGTQAGDTGGLTLRYGTQFIIGFSDTGQVIPRQGPVAPASHFANGVFRLTSSATSTQDVVSGTQSLNTPANWKANQGQFTDIPLHFGIRFKVNTLAGNSVFAGFTDSGGTEMPAYDTGAGILTPAADYCGFIFSGEGGATQQAVRFVAGKAGVDQVASTGITPVAGVYNSYEIDISPDGNLATAYIDAKPVAQITAAITSTVALGAGLWRANSDGAADAVDIDWINIAGSRDTGT